MRIFYIEDDNGQFFSTDRSRRFIRLTGNAAYRYLNSNGRDNTHFYKTTTEEDGGTEVFVEVPKDKLKTTRCEQRRRQYIAERNSKATILTTMFVLLITARRSLRIISAGRFIRLSSRQSCRQFVFTIYAIA